MNKLIIIEHCLTILHEAGGSIDSIGLAIVYVTDFSIKDDINKVFQNIFANKSSRKKSC